MTYTTRGMVIAASIAAFVAGAPSTVLGQEAVTTEQTPDVNQVVRSNDRPRPWVGGHVNLAIPLLSFTTQGSDAVRVIGDDFGTLGLAPGITVHLNERWAIDFEFVAYSDFKNNLTSVVLDPGVWYKFDKITAGLRTAVNVGQPRNWGIIPIIIKGWSVGLINLFVELDLPIFITDRELSVTLQPQLGFSF